VIKMISFGEGASSGLFFTLLLPGRWRKKVAFSATPGRAILIA
jgi:hypothetical protein